MNHRRNTIIALALAFSFSFASFLGAHLSMQGNGHGIMPDCPITGAQQCPMSVTAHVAGWRQLFFATFEKSGLGLLLAIFATLGSLSLLKFYYESRNLAWTALHANRRRDPLGNFSNYLFVTIGSGIVHKRE